MLRIRSNKAQYTEVQTPKTTHHMRVGDELGLHVCPLEVDEGTLVADGVTGW